MKNPHINSNEKPNCLKLNLDESKRSRYYDPDSVGCGNIKLSMELIAHKKFPHNVKKNDLQTVFLLLNLLGFKDKIRKLANASTLFLRPRFKIKTLLESGFSLHDLKKYGVPVRRLLKAGFTIDDLVEAEFTLSSFRDANVSPAILRGSGFSMIELFIAGYPISEIVSARS
ncbi:MAG: hypothetical protein AB8G05_15930 [Oligoflexales bacterium]